MNDTENAPGAGLGPEAPWRWLNQAAKVYRENLVVCAGYGLTFVALGYGMLAVLRQLHLGAIFPVAIGAFGLLGPLMACGLYSVARGSLVDKGVNLKVALRPRAAAPGQLAYLSVIACIASFLWVISALAIYGVSRAPFSLEISDYLAYALTTNGLLMIAIGTVVGGVIATILFCISAFSFPMLMDEDKDFLSAIQFSLQTVRENPATMLLWAWIIVLCLAVSVATLFLALILLFPLLGMATYFGYVEARSLSR